MKKQYLNNLKTGLNNPLRFILTLLIVSIALYIGSIPLRMESLNQCFQLYSLLYFSALLFPFVLGLLGLIYSFKFIHGLSFNQLVLPIGTKKLDLKRLFFSFSTWFALLILMELIGFLFQPENYRFKIPDAKFIQLVILSVFLLPIQTSFEELLIRSYISQQLYFFTSNIFISIISSSLLFSFMHVNNPESSNYGYHIMFVYYFIAGLFLSIVTFKDNRLELSLGIHAANNIFGAIIVNYEGSVFKTTALFTTLNINILISLYSFCVAGFIFYFICYFKFNWNTRNNTIDD